MNTFTFPKFPGSKTWKSSKHVIETDQTLPYNGECWFKAKFDGTVCDIEPIWEHVKGDTHLNSVYKITGFNVIYTNGSLSQRIGTFKPDNLHLLLNSDDGFHTGCTEKCCCQTIKDEGLNMIKYTITKITVSESEGLLPHTYVDQVAQFENGIIKVDYLNSASAFYACKEDYQPCGTDVIVSIEETDFTFEIEETDLALQIAQSAREYGAGLLPRYIFDLF